VALEDEKATLVDTQRRLTEAIRRTKAMVAELNESLQEVRADIEQKMQALSVDEMCLRSTERSMHAVVERTPPPTSSRSRSSPSSLKHRRHQVALHESSKNEVLRQQDAERLNRHVAQKEETGKALREECARLIQRCQQVATDAAAKSEKRMQDRVNENQSMRRRLEGELRETQSRIEHTKNTMSETRHQIKALEEPIDLTSTCASWRKQRATREHIVDPVSTTLQEHRLTVLHAHQDLVTHHQSEKSNLKELHDRRERLKEDLRDKTNSLHIDLNCLTHEVVRLNGAPWAGLSKSKLSKAIKVDRGFVPGAVPMTAR
jgi:chromosome segregation ATPase